MVEQSLDGRRERLLEPAVCRPEYKTIAAPEGRRQRPVLGPRAEVTRAQDNSPEPVDILRS